MFESKILTDNEIMKAVNYCANVKSIEDCDKCPAKMICDDADGERLISGVSNLINRLQKENKEKDEMLKAQADTIFLYEHVIKDKNEEIEKLRSLCSAKDVIINSQETDNEKLKTQLYLEKYTDIAKRNIKFEVIKELEQKLKVHAYYIDFPKKHRVVDEDDIALVAKEITEVEI